MKSILCVAGLMLICPVFGHAADALPAQLLTWNEDVTLSSTDSQLISSGIMPGTFPNYMRWPRPDEIAASSMNPGAYKRSDCEKWLRKFIKGNLVPADIGNHIVAMKRWKGISEKNLYDVFLVRYRFDGRVFHVVETGLDVVVTVFPADSAVASQDRVKFIGDTAASVLADGLLTRVDSSNFHVTKRAGLSPQLTEVSWKPEAIAVDMKKPTDKELTRKALEIGSSNVEAITDGRAVMFFIQKWGGGPSMPDPRKPRF